MMTRERIGGWGGQRSVWRRATLDDELDMYDGDGWLGGDDSGRTGRDRRAGGSEKHTKRNRSFGKFTKRRGVEAMNTVVWELERLGWEVRRPREYRVAAKGAGWCSTRDLDTEEGGSQGPATPIRPAVSHHREWRVHSWRDHMPGNPKVGKVTTSAGNRLQAGSKRGGPCGATPEHRLEERGSGRRARNSVWRVSVPRERVRGAGESKAWC